MKRDWKQNWKIVEAYRRFCRVPNAFLIVSEKENSKNGIKKSNLYYNEIIDFFNEIIVYQQYLDIHIIELCCKAQLFKHVLIEIYVGKCFELQRWK